MKITESRLRKIILDVIKESMDDIYVDDDMDLHYEEEELTEDEKLCEENIKEITIALVRNKEDSGFFEKLVDECLETGMELWNIKNQVDGNIGDHIKQNNAYSIFLEVIESYDMPLDL